MTMNQRMSVRDVDPEVYKVVGTLNSWGRSSSGQSSSAV